MKLSFSTKHVKTDTFLELAQTALDYGFDAVELYDLDEVKSFVPNESFEVLKEATENKKNPRVLNLKTLGFKRLFSIITQLR